MLRFGRSLAKRAAWLALAALAVAAVQPAMGQDATWELNPSGDFNTGSNWSPTTVPTGTAFFNPNSEQINVTVSSSTDIGGWTFNAGADAFKFTINQTLNFNGAGIVINSGSATIGNHSILNFNNTATAGGATISNYNALNFNNTSTAGSAAITNFGSLIFNDTATARAATASHAARLAKLRPKRNIGTA